MVSIIVFFLVSIILFIAFSNATVGKKMSAAERNLKRLSEKRAYNTVEEEQLKDNFDKRIKIFFEQKIDTFLLEKKEPSKVEKLDKMVRKVYRGKKSYKDWEYNRIFLSIISFSIVLFALTVFKKIYIIPMALVAPIGIYKLSEYDLQKDSENKDWENFIFFPNMLMSLCMLYRVGAVASIMQGFREICEIYEHPLIDEVKQAVKEYDFNKDKYDVLNDLAERVDFKEFTSFINLVVEAEKNNIPIVETLTEYAYEISDKRKILATNQILRLPEKLDFIMYCTSTSICGIYMILPSLALATGQLLSTGII